VSLAFYASGAGREFWTEHWGPHSTEELLAIAERSPLTRLLEDSLPSRGRILEAGCGPGQYVVLFRRAGHAVFGVDFAAEPLMRCRTAFSDTPLAVMDLKDLGFRDGSVAGYVSLGVVEHDAEGPDAILREARRVLEPGGVLLLSVPYVNGVRRLASTWIRRRQREIHEAGGAFYQFAYTRGEARRFLERHGFAVNAAVPYDPLRIVRSALRGHRARRAGGSVGSDAPPAGGGVRALLKRLAYTNPSLALLGHMILFVAVKR
jgi:SAM-dependent methyltransferase